MTEQSNTSKTPEASSTPEAAGGPEGPLASEAPSAPQASSEQASKAPAPDAGAATPAPKGKPGVALPDMQSTFARLVSEDEATSAGKAAGKGGKGRLGKAKDGKEGGDTDKAAKRPRRGRVAIEFAECSLGEIVNASPTGLRARYTGSRKNLPRVEDRFNMQVQTPDGPAFVRARVAWIKRVGLRTHDIGVHFMPADEKSATKLSQLATMAGRSIIITEETGGTTLRAG